MLDKGHCWSANNISVWTDLCTNLLPVVKGPSTSNSLVLYQTEYEKLYAYVCIDRVPETKANGQIYEWNSPIYQFYEWNDVTFCLKFKDQILIIMYLG